MKKIIIANGIVSPVQRRNSFLSRSDIKVFVVASQEEAVGLHKTIHADLVIMRCEGSIKQSGLFYSSIKKEAGPGGVAIISMLPDTSSAHIKGKHCAVDAVFFGRAKGRRVLVKAKQLLKLSWRETYRILLNVAVEGSVCEQTFSCRSIDISATGMLLETTLLLDQGQKVACSFVLPDAKRIEAAGEIVRTIPKLSGEGRNYYGVRFVAVDAEAQAALETLITATIAHDHK